MASHMKESAKMFFWPGTFVCVVRYQVTADVSIIMNTGHIKANFVRTR